MVAIVLGLIMMGRSNGIVLYSTKEVAILQKDDDKFRITLSLPAWTSLFNKHSFLNLLYKKRFQLLNQMFTNHWSTIKKNLIYWIRMESTKYIVPNILMWLCFEHHIPVHKQAILTSLH